MVHVELDVAGRTLRLEQAGSPNKLTAQSGHRTGTPWCLPRQSRLKTPNLE